MVSFRYLVPNAVTIFSLTLGLTAIAYSVNGQVKDACWLVLLSVMLDKLDGSLARLLKAESQLGVELDSFADFVVFGLAPASILIGVRGGAPIELSLQILPAWLYVVCCVLRLARFNTVVESPFKDLFQGVPSTLAGGLVGSTVLVALDFFPDMSAGAPYLSALLGVLAILMVSPVYIPKVGRSRKRYFQIFTAVNIVVVLCLILMRIWPEYLCLVAVTYLLVGAVVGGLHVRSARQAA